MSTQSSIPVKFHHLVLRGSAEEIGRKQGELIRSIPPAMGFFGSGPLPGTSAPVDRSIKLMEQYCPGLVEELAGFSSAAGFPLEKLVYLSITHIGGNHCSHFAMRPEMTASGHVLVGRNYDFGEKIDDLKLTTIFPEGRYASTGFPTLFFGRNDGLNEKGLSVTMSAGGMPVGIMPGQQPPIQEGLQFWAVIRTLLDTCKTVAEAEERLADIPCAGNPILILADAGGNLSLVEIHGPDKKIIRASQSEPYLAATNHYQTDETKRLDATCMVHSDTRLKSIRHFIEEKRGSISVEDIKAFLGTMYPEGPCAHFYPEFFGTLHSCVFDLNECRMEVTFGSPARENWHRIDFNDPQPGEFDVMLPVEHTTADFWKPA